MLIKRGLEEVYQLKDGVLGIYGQEVKAAGDWHMRDRQFSCGNSAVEGVDSTMESEGSRCLLPAMI